MRKDIKMVKDGLKSCECEKKVCHCEGASNAGGYYTAVNDVTMYKVHFNPFENSIVYKRIDMETEEPKDHHARAEFRAISERFSKSIKDAVIRALKESRDFAYDRKAYEPENIMERLEYNVDNGCFIFEEFVTLGTRQSPKDCQWEKFFEGKYEFICVRNEIQILKTELANISDGILADVSEEACKAFHVGEMKMIEKTGNGKIICELQ